MAYYGVAYTRKILDTKNFSFKYNGEIENGSLVRKGALVAGETQIYEALIPTTATFKEELYLINTPATSDDTSHTVNQNAENFINKDKTVSRGYRIPKNSEFDLSTYSIEGDVSEGNYVTAQDNSLKLIATTSMPDADTYGFIGKINRIYEKGFFYPIGEFGTDLTLNIDGTPQYMGSVLDGRINYAVIEVVQNG